jgi:Fur family ferric uptake transcriptional regulator
MDESIMQKVRGTLTSYLEENKRRKTPERFAILEAIYNMNGHFTLEELGEQMEKNNFRVSRATLYNAIHLFIQLRLVVKHTFQQGTKYEASFHNDNHCHQICTVCGKVKEVNATHVGHLVDDVKLKRFHKDGFALYIYGICSSCQTRMARMKNKKVKSTKKTDTKK